MKKISLLFLLCCTCYISFSQVTPVHFENIKQLIKQTDPDIDISDKLIMISFWSPANNESRDLNKEIARIGNIYKVAKLKGGKNGFYFFNYCVSEDLVNYKLALKRDSLNMKSSFLQNEESKALFSGLEIIQIPQTILFNSNGDVVEQNTKKEDVFKLISKQITR